MSRQLARHSFTVDDYERMGEAGILHPDDRFELLEGEIYKMPPIGSPHAACVDFLAVTLTDFAQRRFGINSASHLSSIRASFRYKILEIAGTS